MLSLDRFTNQTVSHKTRGIDAEKRGEHSYTSTDIKARFIYKRSLIQRPGGEELVSNAVLYTSTLITEGDIIVYDSKDWPVVDVFPYLDRLSNIIGYKCFM